MNRTSVSLVDVQLFERPHPFPFEKSRFLKSKNPKPPDSSLPVCENNPAITIMTSRPNENHSAPRQRFSMIRNFVAADWLTLGNGFCGTGSVLSVLQYLVSAETSLALFGDGADTSSPSFLILPTAASLAGEEAPH
jgi:hypothetical protein